MNTERDFDRITGAWLDLMPDEAPDRVIDAVLQAVTTEPQVRRGILGRRWVPGPIRLPAPMAVILLLGLLLAAAVGIGLFGGGGQGFPAVVPATPTLQPSVAPATPTLQPSVGPSLPTPIAILPGEPWLVYASPSGSRTGGGLILARPDGTDRHEILARPDARLDHPDWSRDGSMLAYDSWSPDEASPSFDRIDIWISDADGANARQVTTCESPCLQRSWAAWSPDGTKLAMIRYDLTPDQTWGRSALEILDLASGDIRVVTETEDGLVSYYTPRWSPDGRRIVFGLETYTDASQSTLVTSALAVTSVVGSDAELTILTPPDLEARFPDWHPTDDRIVFQARRPESGASTTDLYIIGADQSNLTNLTAFGGKDRGAEMPTWAPDGLRIWFSSQSGRPQKTAASMAADGSDRLVVNLDLAASPRLRPTP